MHKKILIISPHTDDGELGCGGSIAKFIEEGDEVEYIALSCCEKSIPPEYPRDILSREVKTATRTLGIENPVLFSFDLREFPKYRQEILDALIRLRNKINPDIVFTPSRYDTHQDHKTAVEETMRAFKNAHYWVMNSHGIILRLIPLPSFHLVKSILRKRSMHSLVMKLRRIRHTSARTLFGTRSYAGNSN